MAPRLPFNCEHIFALEAAEYEAEGVAVEQVSNDVSYKDLVS